MTLAEQLYDAQVQWVVDQLLGDRLAEVVAGDVDTLLRVHLPLRRLVDVAEVQRVARLLIGQTPATAAADRLVRRTAQVLHAGPDEPFTAADVLGRPEVEALVDAVLHGSRLAEKPLDELARSPLVATVASRFVGRLVGEVLAANKAAAGKVPGLAGLVSLGTGAASMAMGAADKQFSTLLGGATGKGATFAARRLNKILLETLRDPTTREAVLQVWDTYATEPLPAPAALVEEVDALRFAAVLHAAIRSGAASAPVAALVDAVVAGFFTEYGDHTPAGLLHELGLERDRLAADVTSFVGTAAAALHEDGVLEHVVRARLAGFWTSAAVAAILSG